MKICLKFTPHLLGMDKNVIDELGDSLREDMRFSIEAGRRVLKNTEW